jgi:hypothetical protein
VVVKTVGGSVGQTLVVEFQLICAFKLDVKENRKKKNKKKHKEEAVFLSLPM